MEVLGAVASSIALVQAVKGTLKAVDFLRKNSEMKKECNNLKREILMIECFIMQARQQTDPTMPAQRLLGLTEHPLVSLVVEELQDILNELDEIVEKYSPSRKAHDPKRYTARMKWLSGASKIEELQERAKAIKWNLHMAITFRISSMVDRGNVRQEVLFHRVTQQLTYYTHESRSDNQTLPECSETSRSASADSAAVQQPRVQQLPEREMIISSEQSRGEIKTPNTSLTSNPSHTTLNRIEGSFTSVTTIQPLSSRTCSLTCQCRCHRNQREFNSGTWAKSLLGSWLVRYEFSGSACKGKCGTNTGVKLEYQLPRWLWAGIVSFEACQGPKLDLSLRPCRVLSRADHIFYIIHNPRGLQEHLNEGHKYFPDDSDEIHRNLLEYAISFYRWESVGILIKLWENLLLHRGLPRTTGYEFMNRCGVSEPQVDAVNAIKQSLLRFIPDWDEVCTTDIHLAARDRQGTGENMLKALLTQPWAIDELDERGRTPIHYAICAGNPEAVDLLIMAKANINRPDFYEYTPLMTAIDCNEDEITKRLLEDETCRLHINCTEYYGYSALHHAIARNSLDSVCMLLEAGASVRCHNKSSPILHNIIGRKNKYQETSYEITRLLLKHGADLEERNNDGRTPLLWAVFRQDSVMLRSLVTAGASLSATDRWGENILHYMAFNPSIEIIDYLTKQNLAGIELEQRTTQGYNPLYLLYTSSDRESWYKIGNFTPPNSAETKAFITLYFDLLIPDLQRHLSTINNLLQAVKDEELSTAAEILDQLIKKKSKCLQTGFVGWYRGLKGYVIDGAWDHLVEVLEEELDETHDKIERAVIARDKDINDPEMVEFFLLEDSEGEYEDSEGECEDSEGGYE